MSLFLEHKVFFKAIGLILVRKKSFAIAASFNANQQHPYRTPEILPVLKRGREYRFRQGLTLKTF